MKFRADLNAMRAYAVACVVLYHFKLAGLAGGFLGVDVFFVISGYLMTSSILKSMNSGGYAFWPFFWSFMWARARRIVPGLLVLLALVMLIGAAIVPPEAFASLGLHALSSALFYANFVYANSKGYFQGPTAFSWLMHTWSLSVEWQFYCLLPIGLAVLHRLRSSPLAIAGWLAAFGLMSLGLNLYAIDKYPNPAFFWLPCRAWELLGGAAVAAWQHARTPSPINRTWAILAWLVLLVSPFTLGDLAWPSAWTLIPVGAAMVIIAAGRDEASLWRHPWVHHIGLWSYSIYLFHWPLQVAVSYLGLAEHTLVRCAATLASVLLGHLGYRFVETPGRAWLTPDPLRPLQRVYRLAPALGVVLLSAAMIIQTRGLPGRYSDAVVTLESAQYDYNPRSECLTHAKSPLAIHQCVYGSPMNVGLLVWGDSHGDAVMPAVAQSVETSVEFSGHAGCPPLIGTGIKGERCAAFSKLAYERVREAPSHVPVLIIGRWTDYLDPLERTGFNAIQDALDMWKGKQERQRHTFIAAMHTTFCELAKQRPVYVMRPLPEMNAPVPLRAAVSEIISGRFDDDTIAVSAEHIAQRHRVINAALDDIAAQCHGVTVLNPYPYLCPQGTCRASAHGRLLYIDRDHLSLAGDAQLAPMFRAGLSHVDALAMSQGN